MSGFEKLVISHVFTPETRDEGRAMQVTTIACKNLKHLSLGFAMSTGVISTIARQCPRLTKCYFWDDEIIDDEDLCQRSPESSANTSSMYKIYHASRILDHRSALRGPPTLFPYGQIYR